MNIRYFYICKLFWKYVVVNKSPFNSNLFNYFMGGLQTRLKAIYRYHTWTYYLSLIPLPTLMLIFGTKLRKPFLTYTLQSHKNSCTSHELRLRACRFEKKPFKLKRTSFLGFIFKWHFVGSLYKWAYSINNDFALIFKP